MNARTAFLIVVILLAGGCFDIERKVEIRNDGSVRLEASLITDDGAIIALSTSGDENEIFRGKDKRILEVTKGRHQVSKVVRGGKLHVREWVEFSKLSEIAIRDELLVLEAKKSLNKPRVSFEHTVSGLRKMPENMSLREREGSEKQLKAMREAMDAMRARLAERLKGRKEKLGRLEEPGKEIEGLDKELEEFRKKSEELGKKFEKPGESAGKLLGLLMLGRYFTGRNFTYRVVVPGFIQEVQPVLVGDVKVEPRVEANSSTWVIPLALLFYIEKPIVFKFKLTFEGSAAFPAGRIQSSPFQGG